MKKISYQISSFVSLLCAASLGFALNFSNFYIFGDSLSDIGNQKDAPATNKPGNLWAQDLKQKLGGNSLEASKNGGTDFAYAGSLTQDLAGQLAQLQARHAQLDSHALYSVWSGGNDIFQLSKTPDPTAALLPITEQGTGNIVSMLNSLHALGARYIIVGNLPDLGAIPLARDPRFAKAGIASNYFNNVLANKISTLPYDVIQVDIYSLLDEVVANPQVYGFDNVTTPCGNGDCSRSLFYDSIHPSAGGHKIIADYIYSVLTAPQFAALLAELPSQAFTAQNRIIEQNLPPQANKLPVGKAVFFAGGNYTDNKNKALSNDSSVQYAGDTKNLTTGLLYAINPALTTGVAFSYSQNQNQFAQINNSSIDWRSKLLALFANYQTTKAYLNTIFSLGTVQFNNIHRKFYVGPRLTDAQANADGNLYGAHIGSGYHLLAQQNFTTGPFLTLDYVRVTVDGYTERGAGAANIGFATQKRNFLTSGLGWEATLKQQIGQVATVARIFAAGNRQWLNGDRNIGFHVASIAGSHASLPVEGNTANYLSTGLNVGAQLSQRIGLSLGYEFDKGNHNLQQHNVMLNLQYQFS